MQEKRSPLSSSTLSNEPVVENTENEEFRKYLQESRAEIDEKEAEIRKGRYFHKEVVLKKA